MNSLRRCCLAASCAAAFFNTASAQEPANPESSPPPARPTESAPDPLQAVRRNSAIALVNAAADEARDYRDPVARARAQARSADLLWDVDRARSRLLFRRAWEAAEDADEANARRAEEGRNTREGRAAAYNFPNLRREVLRLASARDRELGEEFLGRLAKKEKGDDAAKPGPPEQAASARIDPDNPPPQMAQRLRLARELLEEGNVEQALQFADSALYPVNTFGINFLDALREKNSQEADRRYSALLTRAASDPASDANTVSLLASYAFTPYLYVTFRPDGNSHTRQWSEGVRRREDFPQQLRSAFLSVASAILLRPVPPPDQDMSSARRPGTYLAIQRLLPLFEQYAPDKVPALSARLALLQQDTPERVRQESRDVVRRGIASDEPEQNMEQEFLDRLNRARNQDERDRLYAQAALRLARSDPQRSDEFVEKIEDSDLRGQMRGVLAFNVLSEAVRGKRGEDALKAAGNDSLTPVQRAWGLTEAARLLAKDDPGRAAEALERALSEARRIDKGSPERVRALVAAATQFHLLDRPRAWELMDEVVAAANAVGSFTGEDGGVVVRAEFKGGGAMTMNFNVESFDLGGIFASLAGEDFDRAAALARGLTNESAHAAATLAVARAVLAEKK